MEFIKKTAKIVCTQRVAWALVLFCFLGMMVHAITTVETTNDAEKKTALEDAIMRSALHCYSLEGAYPADVSYLEENYSLAVDWDTYIVHYEIFARNIAPDITVIVKTSQGEESV